MRSNIAESASSTRLYPPLKWAGGKRWLSEAIREVVGSVSGRYFEPFAGGAATFFATQPKAATLSDINPELINVYTAIRDSHVRLVAQLRAHQALHSKQHFYEVRANVPRGYVAQAARTIYLNRTCWNGLYRVNQRGEFNVPIGTKSSVLLPTDDFPGIASALKHCDLRVADFEEVVAEARIGDLVFADPPYTVMHKNNGFIKYNESLFSWSDQIRLRNSLAKAKSRGVRVVATNADHPSIRELYSEGFELREVVRHSKIAGDPECRAPITELLIC